MANEVTLNATLAYSDSESADLDLQITDLLASVSTKKFTHAKQNIGITEEALQLGEVTALGWVMLINRDSTNYIELRIATAGTRFCKLYPGKPALFYFGSGVTAPFAIADTAPCQLEYLLISQ